MADKTIQQQRLMFAQGFHSPKTALAKNTGFTDQVGAFFRQTNTVYNLAIAMNEPIFPPERGYNPAEDPDVMANPWIREKYPEAFTSLMKAESRVEANYLVNKIREENRDREVIQEGGLVSNIFAGLGAGVVDPVNWIAFSGATRAAKALNVAARPMTIAGIGAAENVLGLTVAEPFLRIAQETRTDEEFQRDLVGGAIFGAIIGGMSGGISSTRTAASRALLGADTVEDALDPASYSAWLQRNPVEQQRLDELIEGDEGFAIFGQDREEVAGILLKATSEINPGLAKVLGISQGILGKLLAKLLFLNPEMNLARSESQFARGALDIMLKPAIVRTDTLNRQSVEAVMGIAEIAGLRIRHDMNLVFAEYRSAGGRLSNAEVMVLGAKAAVRGDIVDPANASHELSVSPTTGELELVNPFESIIGDSQTIKAVEEVAKINRKFFDTLRKTGESAGAFTGEDFINSIELENYLTRVYKKEKIMVYLPQFKKSIFLALEDKKARELPEMEVERQKLVDEHEALSAPDPVAPPTRTPLPLEEPPSLATPDPSSINETTWYHGSAVEIERPSQDHSRTDSLFGIGFYMTDAPSVARGYGPVSHRVKVDVRKTLDFDEDLPDDAFDLIVSNARVLIGDDNWVPSSRKGSEVWDDMVTELYQMTISVDEAAETFQIIADELRHVLGYDAITHIGGGRAGRGRRMHRVLILLDPEGDRWGAVPPDSISHRSVLSIDTEPPPPTTTPAAPARTVVPGRERTDAAGMVDALEEEVRPLDAGYDETVFNYQNDEGIEVTLKDEGELININGKEFAGDIEIDLIHSTGARGEGAASRELDRILAEADSRDMSVSLSVDAQLRDDGLPGLTDDQLKAWYERKGFVFPRVSLQKLAGYRPRISEGDSLIEKTIQIKASELPTARKQLAQETTTRSHSDPDAMFELFDRGELKTGFHEGGDDGLYFFNGTDRPLRVENAATTFDYDAGHHSVTMTEPPPPTTTPDLAPTPRSPEDLAEIVWDRARLEREIAEYDEWIAKLGDEERWEEIANQVYENITNDTGTGPLGGGAGNSLKQRVLTVEDRFIAPWLEDDVMNIQANQIRNLLPKLILSGEMDSAMDGFQVSANLKNRLTTVTAKLDTLSEDPTSLTPAALESIHLELEQVLDDAAHLNLSSHMRLHIDVKQLGFSSMEKAQTHLNSLVVNLKNFRADLHAKRKVVRGIDSQIALLRSEIEGLDANGRPVSAAMQKSLDDLVVERTKKNKELLEVTAEFDQTRSGINTMAGKLIFTEKSYGWKLGSSAADRSDALKFGRNFIDDLGAVTDLQKLQRLMEMRAMVIQRSSSSRRSAFDINSDAEQVKARIEEDYRGLHIGVQQNARMTMKKKKREEEKLLKRKSRDLRDMGLIFDRFHRTDGTGNESLGRAGAAIREANYVRLGGGFLLSSTPDLAMGIGQVGLPSYFRALARYMNPFFRNKRLSEDMADWVFASEATLGGDRNRRIAGLDEEDPKRNHFIERGLHATSKGFNNLLMLNKWNGMMKSVNSVAIQNKIIKIGNKLRSGKRLSRSDKAFMGGLGLTEDRLQRIAILQEKFGDTESTILGGKFYLSRTRKWGAAGDIDARTALEDRLAFERATFQRVQQTIITPGAGSLPNWMTSTEFGRIIGQFGSFTMAATSQLLIPMLQKGAMMGDMNQALMFVGASTLGAVGYWARRSLDGKDPFEDEVKKDKRGRVTARVPWWKKSILEGIDRGGTLGWLSQGNAYMERMTGVGASTLLGAGQLSRMKSRSKVDMLAGPTAGLLNDFGTVLGALAEKGFEGKELTEGAYNAGRRMVGWQNLIQTRLALDVAPSIYDAQRGGYGSPTYFDKFIPIQQRLRNTLQEE
jgi:hypothetical protein